MVRMREESALCKDHPTTAQRHVANIVVQAVVVGSKNSFSWRRPGSRAGCKGISEPTLDM